MDTAKLQRAFEVGAGRSGLSAARLLLREGAAVTIADARPREAVERSLGKAIPPGAAFLPRMIGLRRLLDPDRVDAIIEPFHRLAPGSEITLVDGDGRHFAGSRVLVDRVWPRGVSRAIDRIFGETQDIFGEMSAKSQQNAAGAPPETVKWLADQSEAAQQGFSEAMDDDFNSAGALAALFELVRVINTARDVGATDAQLKPARQTLRSLTSVLGLRLEEKKASGGDADKFIALLVEVRSEVRKQKLWALSDLIRDRLKELGVTLEDGKEGSTWRW